jgi:hypothetical protein
MSDNNDTNSTTIQSFMNSSSDNVKIIKEDDNTNNGNNHDDKGDKNNDIQTNQNEAIRIKELQTRLEKRNLLLDIIRKAYHRDVLVVREGILQNQRQIELQQHYRLVNQNEAHDISALDYESIDDLKNNVGSATASATTASTLLPLSSSLSTLSSIPSIDLRHEGLHLFSPQECELRLNPCFECGGHFEVIHRESSRYTALLCHRDELLEKIRNLEEEVRILFYSV